MRQLLVTGLAMPNPTRTPLAVRVVLSLCVAGALSVVACVKDPGSPGSGGPVQQPGTVTFSIQAH